MILKEIQSVTKVFCRLNISHSVSKICNLEALKAENEISRVKSFSSTIHDARIRKIII